MSNSFGSAPDISLLLWGVSATPLFLTVEESRKGNLRWAIAYGSIFLSLVTLGFFWPMLPGAVSTILQAKSSTIFLLGAYGSSVGYALLRRRWVKYGDRRLSSGLGEGLAVFIFVTLISAPLVGPAAVAEVFVEHSFLFFLGGLAGLALVYLDTGRREREGRSKLNSSEDSK